MMTIPVLVRIHCKPHRRRRLHYRRPFTKWQCKPTIVSLPMFVSLFPGGANYVHINLFLRPAAKGSHSYSSSLAMRLNMREHVPYAGEKSAKALVTVTCVIMRTITTRNWFMRQLRGILKKRSLFSNQWCTLLRRARHTADLNAWNSMHSS